jgi:hypothetical protein
MPQLPEHAHEQQCRRRKHVLPPDGAADRPARVSEDQVNGPEKFSQIKPDHAAGDQRPLDKIKSEIRAARSHDLGLDPRGEQTGGNSGQEER